MRVVDHDLEARALDRLHVKRREIAPGVDVQRIRGIVDVADVLQVDAAVVLAEEEALDRPFLLAASGSARPVPMKRISTTRGSYGREAHVDAAGRPDRAGVVARDRNWQALEVEHVVAGRRQARDQRTLDHARAAMRIAVDGHRAAFGQHRAERRAQPRDEIGGEVHVDDAGHAVAAEQHTAALRVPR